MLLEDFPGMADNLMIEGAIVASGGRLVTRDLPRSAAWSDLRAFEACLAEFVAARKDVLF